MKQVFVVLVLMFLGFSHAQDRIEIVEDEVDTITLRHAFGETTIPKNPERVIIADPLTLGAYASLGEVPLAACGYPLDTGVGKFGLLVTPLLEGATEHLGGCQSFGSGFPLEQMLTLDPDLILIGAGLAGQENSYTLLSEIAPTVAIPFDGSERLRYFEDIARVVGKEEVAQTRIQAHYDRLADIEAQLTDPVDIVVVSLRSAGLTLYGADFSVNTSLVRMGLTFEPAVSSLPSYLPEQQRARDLSFERLDLLDSADLIIIEENAVGSENQEVFEEQVNSPLWQSLSAVQQGNILFINQGELFATASILSFEEVAGQVANFLEERGFLAPAEDEETDMEATEEASD